MLDPKTTNTVEKILKFGRELHALSLRLRREFGKNEANKKALRVSVCHLPVYCHILDKLNRCIADNLMEGHTNYNIGL